MAEFKIGDKVRNKCNHDIVGIIDNVDISYMNTIDVRLNSGSIMYQVDSDCWELYFEVGDIVLHKRRGEIYQIYSVYPGDDNRYNLECFTDVGVRITQNCTSPDDIHLADNHEILIFHKLKEWYEETRKKNEMLLKENLNKVYGIHMSYGERYPIKSSYPGHGGIISEFSKELMEFKKAKEEKETNDMRKFKIGDIVEHWIYGQGNVIGYEKYFNIRVKFKDNCIRLIHEDVCHLVASVEELHDLRGRQSMPKFKQVIYNDPATIIFWEDGTKTVVKCDGTRTITLADGTTKTVKTSEGEKYDELKGLMMGIVKKVYGLKNFYTGYDIMTKYVTGKNTLLNIEKGLSEMYVMSIYHIKKINSKDDIYKVAMTDGFYVSTERK